MSSVGRRRLIVPQPQEHGLHVPVDAEAEAVDAEAEAVDVEVEGVDAGVEAVDVEVEAVDAGVEAVDAEIEEAAEAEEVDADVDAKVQTVDTPAAVDTGDVETQRERDPSSLAVSATPDGILAIDTDGIIRFCNPAGAALLGRRVEDLLGAPVGFPVVPHGISEIDVVRPDGRASAVEIQITTTAWGNELLSIAAMRDVTHRRHAVRTLEAALEERNVVIAVTAHELNDPLYAISLSLRSLRTAQTDEERRVLIDRIAERTEHLQALVRKLRTATKVEQRTSQVMPEPVNVLEFVLERLGAFDRRYQDVELACDPDISVLVDRHDFSEMLANYLENAISYGEPPIEIELETEDGASVICVRDHGPGVPEAYEERLFERFVRGPEAREHADGTGLGLWIVRCLAQANGGDAWYERCRHDRPGFCLRLPNAGRRCAGKDVAPPPEQKVSRSHREE
jgi:signal transduction histidine kinase